MTLSPGAGETSGDEPTGGLASPAREEIANRGRLEIRQRAVERIVRQAALEVPGVGGSVSRVLGQAMGPADPEARPKATVRVAGDLVTAELSLSVAWPAPLNDVAARVRDRVALRLDTLVGMRVGHVDITVTALPHRAARRRVA